MDVLEGRDKAVEENIPKVKELFDENRACEPIEFVFEAKTGKLVDARSSELTNEEKENKYFFVQLYLVEPGQHRSILQQMTTGSWDSPQIVIGRFEGEKKDRLVPCKVEIGAGIIAARSISEALGLGS